MAVRLPDPEAKPSVFTPRPSLGLIATTSVSVGG